MESGRQKCPCNRVALGGVRMHACRAVKTKAVLSWE